MIKIGISGGECDSAGELLRILINHPDVDLKWIESHSLAGHRVENRHHGLLGEFSTTFVAHGELSEIDLLFACAPRAFSTDSDVNLPMIVDLTGNNRIEQQGGGWVYGLPELNRRRIVHDCRRVACPSALADAVALALLPPARNLLLAGSIDVECHLPHGISHDGVRGELQQAVAALQQSFDGDINLSIMPADSGRALRTVVSLDCNIEVDMVRQLFEEYYDDHNLTHVVTRDIDSRDVVNTAKALIYISRADNGRLLITTMLDPVVKGGAGCAVHNMNLLCGLHERVGLALKALA